MQAEEFTWEGGIHLNVQGRSFDLHNDYDFHRYTLTVARRTVSLVWRRSSREGVAPDQPDRIELLMSGVGHLAMRPRDPAMPFTEDDCLASFGYETDEAWRNGPFWVDGPPDPQWYWSFTFQSGAAIVVGADRASVVLSGP